MPITTTTTTPTTMTTLEFLENYVIQNVNLSLKQYIRSSDFITTVVPDEDQLGYYFSHISVILLWSGVGAITLKFHFELDSARTLASKALDKPFQTISDESAMDFMRELNNKVGAMVRGEFERYNIQGGMCLPFVTDGVDEAVFRNILDPRAHCRAWRITHEEYKLVCTTEICLVNQRTLEAVREDLQKEMEARALEGMDSLGKVYFFDDN